MAEQHLPISDLDLILHVTSPLWEEMRGQNLFITGGTGFFGCWLVESFVHINRALDLRAHVTVLTRNPTGFAAKCPHLANDPAVTPLQGDVRDFEFPDGDFPFVIHAATEASAKQAAEEPLEMLTTILAGTESTLKFAAGHGTRKLLLTSSGAIYGPQPVHLSHTPEDYSGAPNSLDPASVYGEGKRASEQMCALYARATGMEIKVARCFAFLGPHLPLDAHFAIGNFIRNAMEGRPISVSGDGTAKRSYLYAADLAIWLWTMLFRSPSLQPFNVGSEHAVSIRELAESVAFTLRPGLPIEIAQKLLPGQAPAQYVPSTRRAQELLQLRQSVSLEDAIIRTAAWHGYTSSHTSQGDSR